MPMGWRTNERLLLTRRSRLWLMGKGMIGKCDMAIRLRSLFFAVVTLALSTQLIADETIYIRDAIRIVVITDDEGIHYERGCAFYELRDLLAANENNASHEVGPSGDPLFEVRVLTRSGNSTVYVGDHWMRTAVGTALLTTSTYERIAVLVQKRMGAGQPISKVDSSIRRASKLIQGPIYVEDNRCEKYE